MSAGRANRRLYRPPEGSIIETDRHGNRRVVTWNEIKKQIAEAAKNYWKKKPEALRPVKLSMRERIEKDVSRPRSPKP